MRVVSLRSVEAPKRIKPASDRQPEAVRFVVEPAVAAIFGVDVRTCAARDAGRRRPHSLGRWPCISVMSFAA